MKAGIVTFQETNNYGAMLQNYALQRALASIGVDSETIDYKSDYIGKPYRLLTLKRKGLMKYLLGVAGYIIYLPRTKRNKMFRRRIKYSEKVNKDSIVKYENSYDLYITGSDQVWNYDLTGFDGYYMLEFVKDKSKCNSYAASLGIAEIDEKYKTGFDKLLGDFHYISVREESAKKAISKVISNEIEVISDPCILLEQKEWDKITLKAPNYSYVYVYQLGVSKDVVEIAKKIAQKHNLKIIFTPFPVGSMAKGKYHISAGCEDVVTYIKNAEYVVTDSFHGTLLSVIYHKRFFTKASGTHSAVGNRIVDMLKGYELSNRMISENIDIDAEIDYTHVDNIIRQNRENGYQVLKKICNM